MKQRLLFLIFAACTLLPAQVSIGVRIGAPPPIRVERNNIRRPSADYVWIDGYWYPERNRYKWHKGYWTRPPFAGARWAPGRYDGRSFFQGFWQNDNDRFDHNHGWDRDRNRRDRDRRDNDRR